MRKAYIALLVSIVVMASCSKIGHGDEHTENSDAIHRQPKYAQGFDIYEHKEYIEIILYNPWKHNDIVTRYYLVRNNDIKTPDGGVKIQIPVERVASTSVTQYEFIALLGEIKSIQAICSPEITYNSEIKTRFAAGKIENLGSSFNINREKMMILNPDVTFATLYNESSIHNQLNDNSGVPTAFDNEWTEQSIIARAEWIKFIGAFYDKSDVADSIFNRIDLSYQSAIKTVSHNNDRKKSVMVGYNYRGTWYMPGGRSFMGQLLDDAEANYYYANDTTAGSLPLNFETVLKNFAYADVWLSAPTKTLDELLKMDERHNLFEAYRNKEVYSFLRRTNTTGANDFWESGIAHPDLILKDVIWALYPDKMLEYEPTYILRCE